MTSPQLEDEDDPQVDDPQVVRDRAVSLVEYLLAVRALIEKPARTVPTTDAFWQADLPRHAACELGPTRPGGSWLRVGRPAAPEPPAITTPLIPYLIWDLSRANPPKLPDEPQPPESVRSEFTQWYEGAWLPWADEVAAAEATRRLHDRLYDLRYRLDIDAARVELIWGHAVLNLPADDGPMRYPLLGTPVAIEYDPETTTVRVVPQGPPRLQPDALSGVDDRRVADLLDLGGPSGQVDVDPWDADERRDFAVRALRRLGLDPVIGDTARTGVQDTSVLFVRPRQRMVRRFLEDMRDRLTPQTIGSLAGVLAHEPSRLSMPDDETEVWQRIDDRLLMPMPTNDAQESIARRLAVHRTVAVQGPPGTGKTHTIRNLICHLVAHGKRVLVLAQKEDPLRVLRDGLPEEIQPLCLAILGRSADQLAQLQIAARELADRAATLDREAESAAIDRLRQDIAQAEAELSSTGDELRAVAERESATYDLAGTAATASEVGEWLRRH
ncbi:MAG TPA: AAA domain-containing protein, partial [Micromonosporaceae bacterium]|nr:AAA domain-containing protein [Micromonosporaceae bacterium]